MQEDRLEQALNELRNESVPPAQLEASQARVLARLAAEAPGLCAAFRADFDAYREGRLGEARRLLVDDHLARCATCRRVLAEARGERRAIEIPLPAARRRHVPSWAGWALAAGLVLGGVYLERGRLDAALAPSGPRATVAFTTGKLVGLAHGPLAAGAELIDGEVVRTGEGARAVLRLGDGSRVELNERTELAVHAALSGHTIRLERGDVIVEAAKQGAWSRLRVSTADSLVTVKGTVFAVSAGMKGSLVSVVEGAVEVRQPEGQRLLGRGDQAASTRQLAGVPVRQAVAWSGEAERYFSLLGELKAIEQQLSAALPAPRTEARLLPYLPADTKLYAAIPNLGDTIGQGLNLLEQRSAGNEPLRELWKAPQGAEFRQLLEKLQGIAPSLGEEVVFVMTGSPGRAGSGPALLLAEVQPGRQAALNQALNEMFAAAPEKPAWRVTDRLLVAADSPASLAALTSTLGQGANSPFAQEIAAHYQRGVRFLFAMDRAAFGMETGGAAASTLGMGGLRYLFFEQRSAGGSDENEASIAFDGPRTGVASWLAAPGPLGSAEYISRDALLAVSVATKNPQQALSELTAAMGRLGPEFGRELAKFEAESGVNLGSDIAAALGTDFALSIDRLSIPTPAWTLAMEVMQPALLDTTIRRLVDRINGLPQTSQAGRRVVYEQQQVNGRDWYTLRTEPPTTAVHWTYDRGYLVAAADRALAMQALATRSGGFPLVRSAEFRAQLPASSGLHQSGFFWLNTKGALAGFAEVLPEGSLKTLAAGEAPLLVAFDGERERIRAVSRTRLTSLVFDALLSHRGANPMGKPGAHAASH